MASFLTSQISWKFCCWIDIELHSIVFAACSDPQFANSSKLVVKMVIFTLSPFDSALFNSNFDINLKIEIILTNFDLFWPISIKMDWEIVILTLYPFDSVFFQFEFWRQLENRNYFDPFWPISTKIGNIWNSGSIDSLTINSSISREATMKFKVRFNSFEPMKLQMGRRNWSELIENLNVGSTVHFLFEL